MPTHPHNSNDPHSGRPQIPTTPAELARYTIPAGERVLYGQRVDGVVRVTDVPADGLGRAYLVERELERDGYAAVKALVADYTAQAQRLGDVPMAVSPLRLSIAAIDRLARRAIDRLA